ncbi:gliding motility-associated C-terminal domain-containing protein [bacterium]|nr:gliding motility-associated C-terminal domain-containing protein [bacterium]
MYTNALATDDCSSFEVTEIVDTTFLNCASNYDIVRTFTVTDACGNMADAIQTIAVRDLTAPVISSTVDQPLLECDDEWSPPTLDAFDNCSDVVWNMTTETVGDPSTGAYVLNVLHIASDACGNTASIAQTVGFVDTTSPTFTTVPSDLVLSCEEEVPLNLAVAEDNCSSVTVEVIDDLELEVGPSEHLLTRTFIATDAQGNTSSAVQLISIVDDSAPEFTFVPADYTVECSDEMPMDDAAASDNCGEVTIEVSSETTAGDATGNYTMVRTFTATDDAGNSTSATQTITVEDTTTPDFTFLPADYTVEGSDEIPMDDATASDNCGEVTIEVSSETTAGDAAGNYTIVRTFTATDDAGNSTSATQTITVQDTTAPEFTFVPADYTVECSDEMPMDDATASDNCGEVTIEVSSETTAGDAAGNYTIVRTFTATDDAGNSTSATQTITVQDTTAPEFTFVPADYTVECSDEMPMDDATASDNCGEVTIEVTSETTAGDATGSYTIERTFVATDNAGNSSTGTQTITVLDTTPPVMLSELSNVTFQCGDDISPAVVESFDNCSDTVTVDIADITTLGDCEGSMTVERTYTLTDLSGNSSSVTVTLNVVDTLAPVWTSTPPDILLSCDDDLPLDEAMAEDGCSAVLVVLEQDTLLSDATGNYEVSQTWSAMDQCGNETFYSRIVTVIDTIGPTVILPADTIVSCDTSIPALDPVVFDNCGEVTWTVTEEWIPGECPGSGTWERLILAVDDAGNSADATQIVHVVDTVAPVISNWPEDLVLTDPANVPDCESNALLWIDNCSEAVVDCDTDTIEEFCPGSFLLERTYTVTDACGNVASAQQSILVEDVEGPVFEDLPNEVTYACDTTLTPPSTGELTITDNQSTMDDILTDVLELDSEGNDCSSFTTFRYTAMDGCGNMTEVFYTQIREDNGAPLLTTPLEDLEFICLGEVPSFDDQVFLLDVEDCQSPADSGTGYDVGLVATAVDEFEGGDCTGPDCLLTRTITVDDNCGNVAMFEQVIVVSEPPTVPELPTGFSPNNDSFNDVYRIRNAGPDLGLPPCDWLDNTTFTVFDRWGSVVYLSNDVSIPWDGTNLNGRPLPVGTYFVVFETNGWRQRIENDNTDVFVVRAIVRCGGLRINEAASTWQNHVFWHAQDWWSKVTYLNRLRCHGGVAAQVGAAEASVHCVLTRTVPIFNDEFSLHYGLYAVAGIHSGGFFISDSFIAAEGDVLGYCQLWAEVVDDGHHLHVLGGQSATICGCEGAGSREFTWTGTLSDLFADHKGG